MGEETLRQGVLTSTCGALPQETACQETYLPEDGGCQCLVGQKKTDHLKERERGEAEKQPQIRASGICTNRCGQPAALSERVCDE